MVWWSYMRGHTRLRPLSSDDNDGGRYKWRNIRALATWLSTCNHRWQPGKSRIRVNKCFSHQTINYLASWLLGCEKKGSKWSVHIKGVQLAGGAYAHQIYLTDGTSFEFKPKGWEFSFPLSNWTLWQSDWLIEELVLVGVGCSTDRPPVSVLVLSKIMKQHEGLIMSSENLDQSVPCFPKFGFILCTLWIYAFILPKFV